MGNNRNKPRFYRLAGQVICNNQGLWGLEMFRIKKPFGNVQKFPEGITDLANFSPVLQTSGWMADGYSTVILGRDEYGYLMEIPAVGRFWISLDGSSIFQIPSTNLSTQVQFDDALLGPPLILALALRGTWCLHASAAIYKDNLILFLGDSGQGKSTLVGYLASENTDWHLVADDLLPVNMQKEGLTAWPHFPQPKLPQDKQPGASLPEKIMVSKVCVLMSSRSGGKAGLQLLSAGQAIQEYLGHTAGARLFEPDLLEKHLAFCAQAAGTVPVYRLPYTRRREALPRIKEQLESLC